MVNVNMNDPSVRRLLDDDGGRVIAGPQDASGKPMVQIAGDPAGGISHTTQLDIGKHEVGVLYASSQMAGNVDVFAIPGEPVQVHFICPRCHHRMVIASDRKAVDYRPTEINPQRGVLRAVLPAELAYTADFGVLSIEPFGCKWELEDQMADKGKDIHVITGGSLCKWRGAIDRNVVREA